MDRFRIICPKCNEDLLKFLNPEIEVNKVRCTNCGGEIEVRFDDDEIQMWDQVS